MKELEKHEDFIVRRTVEKSLEQFPVFQAERPQAYDKGRRDTTLVLRYAALSWVNEDPEIFTEKVLYWMQTIVASMGFCDVAKFTYTYMQQLVSESLDDEAGVQGINHYLQMVVDVMEQ
jgi:hypothetical protein